MTHIKMDCTYGGVKNPTLKIGEGEGEIPLAEAETLVAEGMGKPYTPDGLSASDTRVKELEGQVTDLTARNAELEGQLALLSPTPPVTPPKGGK
jgi:hypothetical protein